MRMKSGKRSEMPSEQPYFEFGFEQPSVAHEDTLSRACCTRHMRYTGACHVRPEGSCWESALDPMILEK